MAVTMRDVFMFVHREAQIDVKSVICVTSAIGGMHSGVFGLCFDV